MKHFTLYSILLTTALQTSGCSSTPENEVVTAETEKQEPAAAKENPKPTQKPVKTPAPKPAPTPKPTPTPAITPAATSPSQSVALPSPGSLEPFFAHPEMPQTPQIAKLIGQDAATLERTDLRPQATAPRVAQISALIAKVKEASGKKDLAAFVAARQKLQQFLKEHALYLEYILATGQRDPALPTPAQSAATIYSHMIQNATILKKRASEGPVGTVAYDADILTARLRLGDTGAVSEAQKFITENSGSTYAIRVKLVGIGEDSITHVFQGAFGTPQETLDLPQSANSRAAALYMTAAASESKKNYSEAQDRYIEAINHFSALTRPGATPLPITPLTADRVVQTTLALAPIQTDEQVLELLRRLGLKALKRYYIEQVALIARQKNPAQAIQVYKQIELDDVFSNEEKAKMVARLLDFALLGNDKVGIRSYFETLLKLNALLKLGGLDHRANTIIKQASAQFQTKPSKENLATLVSTHDLLRERLPEYRLNDAAELEIIAILMKQNMLEPVVFRSEALAAGEGKKPETKRLSLSYAIRARERALGIAALPDWKPAAPGSLPKEVALPYLKNLSDFSAATTVPSEKETALFQASYIAFFGPDLNDAVARLETAIVAFPASKQTQKGVTFFLEYAEEVKDYAILEKVARAADKAQLPPLKRGGPDFKTIAQGAILESGKALAAAQKPDEALAKFRLCQKDFPSGTKSVDCMIQSAIVLEKQNKLPEALAEYEKITKLSPVTPLIVEARWETARLSEKKGDTSRAAQNYESYSLSLPAKSAEKKSWLLAAQNYKKAKNPAKAIECYQQYLKGVTDKIEKLRTTKELASMLREAKDMAGAIVALDQAIAITKTLPNAKTTDEELLLHGEVLDILFSTGQQDDAVKRVKRIESLTPKTREGMLVSIQVKRLQGEQIAQEIEEGLANGTNFAPLIAKFESSRKLLQAECEVPNSKYCAQSRYLIAKSALLIKQAFAKTSQAEQNAAPEKIRNAIASISAQLSIQIDEARTAVAQQTNVPKDLAGKIEELAKAAE